MKIAVCISGQARNYEKGYQELKKWFLDKYDCDIYIHTWKDKKIVRNNFDENFTPSHSYELNDNDFNRILDLYKPKAHYFQHPIPFDVNDIKGILNRRLNNLLSAAYSIQACYDLVKESGIKYDLVIRYRFDLRFTDWVYPDCQFLTDITQLDPNQVSVFEYDQIEGFGDSRPGEIDDLFAVGGMDVMEVYSNYFSWILYYQFIDESGYWDWLLGLVEDPDKMVAESYLKYHLVKNNIPINFVNSNNPDWFTAGIIR